MQGGLFGRDMGWLLPNIGSVKVYLSPAASKSAVTFENLVGLGFFITVRAWENTSLSTEILSFVLLSHDAKGQVSTAAKHAQHSLVLIASCCTIAGFYCSSALFHCLWANPNCKNVWIFSARGGGKLMSWLAPLRPEVIVWDTQTPPCQDLAPQKEKAMILLSNLTLTAINWFQSSGLSLWAAKQPNQALAAGYRQPGGDNYINKTDRVWRDVAQLQKCLKAFCVLGCSDTSFIPYTWCIIHGEIIHEKSKAGIFYQDCHSSDLRASWNRYPGRRQFPAHPRRETQRPQSSCVH